MKDLKKKWKKEIDLKIVKQKIAIPFFFSH